MSWEYTYTKEVNPDVLREIIDLDNRLRAIMEGMYTHGDAITIVTIVALTPDQHDILNVLVDSYNDTHPLVVRKNIEVNVMTPAMKYGMSFLAKFSSNNIYLNKTAEQVGALLTMYPDVIHAALTGSLQALYYTTSTMVADDNISQEEIDEFKLRLEIQLGIV